MRGSGEELPISYDVIFFCVNKFSGWCESMYIQSGNNILLGSPEVITFPRYTKSKTCAIENRVLLII